MKINGFLVIFFSFIYLFFNEANFKIFCPSNIKACPSVRLYVIVRLYVMLMQVSNTVENLSAVILLLSLVIKKVPKEVLIAR